MGMLCTVSAGDLPVHFSQPASSLTFSQEILAQELHDQPEVRQVDTGLRRAALSRYASRRLLARRPVSGPRRHHMRRWGHR